MLFFIFGTLFCFAAAKFPMMMPLIDSSSSSSNSRFYDDSSSSSSSSTASRPIHWKYVVVPAHPLIYKSYFKPGKATGVKTFIPGQDYKFDYYEQGNLAKKTNGIRWGQI